MFWFIFVFLILTSYNCNLRAYLLAVDYEAPMENEEDLINQKRILNLPSGSANIDMFKDSPLEVHQKIYRAINIYDYSEKEQKRIFEENGVVMTTVEKHGSHDHSDEKPFRTGKKVSSSEKLNAMLTLICLMKHCFFPVVHFHIILWIHHAQRLIVQRFS